MESSRLTVWLPAIFAIVVASFVGATVVANWQIRAIDKSALDIAENEAPAIEQLSAARGEVRRLQVLLRTELDRDPIALDDVAIEESRQRLDNAIKGYLLLPAFPEERELWKNILAAKDRVDDAVVRIEDAARRGDGAAARRYFDGDLHRTANELVFAIARAIDLNAQQTHDLAVNIRRVRTTTTSAAVVLEAICIFIAVAGGIATYRLISQHTRLLEAHRELHESRAAELEAFAGRVAHDILSPLNAVMFALDVASGDADAEQRARFLRRGTSAVERVKKLVTALLSFARAGAKPELDAHADVQEVLLDLLPELEANAKDRGIEIAMDSCDADVACEPGVLTSLVANLAHNALKYMGESSVRRVDIRALDRGATVRVEVEDTGPGLSPDVEDRAFEPYARGHHRSAPGIGLGLATVKRLAEAHGGSVGVRSLDGRGCLFWFELPRARYHRPGDEAVRLRSGHDRQDDGPRLSRA